MKPHTDHSPEHDSFAKFREDPRATRRIVTAGIVVLIVALLGAIAAAVIALSRPQAPVVVRQAPTTTVTAPIEATELTGSFVGDFSLARADSTGESWKGVLTLAGATGLLVYPGRDCEVFLDAPRSTEAGVQYSAVGVSGCQAQGTWLFRRTDVGLSAEYRETSPAAASTTASDAASDAASVTAELTHISTPLEPSDISH